MTRRILVYDGEKALHQMEAGREYRRERKGKGLQTHKPLKARKEWKPEPKPMKRGKPMNNISRRGRTLTQIDAAVREIVWARDCGECRATAFFGAPPNGITDPVDLSHITAKNPGADVRRCTANAMLLSRGWHLIRHGSARRHTLRDMWWPSDDGTATQQLVYRWETEDHTGRWVQHEQVARWIVPMEWV